MQLYYILLFWLYQNIGSMITPLPCYVVFFFQYYFFLALLLLELVWGQGELIHHLRHTCWSLKHIVLCSKKLFDMNERQFIFRRSYWFPFLAFVFVTVVGGFTLYLFLYYKEMDSIVSEPAILWTGGATCLKSCDYSMHYLSLCSVYYNILVFWPLSKKDQELWFVNTSLRKHFMKTLTLEA